MDFQKRQPTLYVGLGGAGGKIVNRIASILHNRPDWETMQNVMQFFVIDTDKADLDNCTSVPQAHRFAISGFDKGLWVMDKLGRGGVSKPDSDPRVAQWVHDWYNFRSSQGAGAGQIRIESRVSLYNALESTDLIKRIEEAILKTITKENTLVDFEVKKFNVFIYYTVAGGTGSGAHLMMAAFLRQLIANFGWSANIIGVSVMSTLVLPLIRNMRQRGDILANGFSAMKEVEHLMRLKVFSDQRDPSNRRDFIYHPFISSQSVEHSPFDFVYVLDTNPEVYIENWRTSAADAIYLQLFSPIFAVRNSDYDNYEKNQKRLARGLYATFYGSYGCSVLLLPDNDMLKYCCSRRVADVIDEHLSTNLRLELPSGVVRDLSPTTDALEDLDHIAQERLWDECFITFLRARVRDGENTPINGSTDPKSLKKHGRALYKRGFALSLDVNRLRKATEEIKVEEMPSIARSRLHKMILPRSMDPGEIDDTDGEAQDGPSSVVFQFKTDIEAFLLSYRSVASTVGNLIRVEKIKDSDEYRLVDGDFREFWNKLDRDYVTSIADSVRFEHHRTTRGVALDEGNRQDIEDQFRENIRRNVQQLREAEEKARTISNNLRDNLGRKYISDFLASKSTPFELQRMFVLAHRELSECLREILVKVVGTDMDSTKEALAQALRTIESDEGLIDAAGIRFPERIEALFGRGGAQDFAAQVSRLDNWVRHLSDRYSALIFLNFLKDLHDHLCTVFTDAAENFRRFSKQAQDEIRKIVNDAEEFRRHPGGAAQAEEFHNDIEALQGFDGERMWKDYYDVFVKPRVSIRATKIHDTIAAVFSDRLLTTPRDQIDKIRLEFYEIVEHELHPQIVGEYSEGKEKRGLTLQAALEAEAQLKYRERLRSTGQWDDKKVAWERVIFAAGSSDLHSRSQVDLHGKMRKFSRNYLESKIASCIRRSAIMANIDMEDIQVTEFACKQSLLCYDKDIYPEPKADQDTLEFPSLVRRINSEFMAHDYNDNGKMAIFYQAILGVPLFVFRNIVGGMRDAYNNRVGERNWLRPTEGRQYPLHIDRNWEPGDPGVDDSKLPLSLHPEEAVVSSRDVNAERCRFFSYWYALHRTGNIVRKDDVGFVVPSGKLGNTGEEIRLGTTVREAIQAMMKAQSAHDTLEATFREAGPLELKELEEHRDFCLNLIGGDVWGNTDPDPEIQELAALYREFLEFQEGERARDLQRAARREAFSRSSGKHAPSGDPVS